jgi:hypothetical protein
MILASVKYCVNIIYFTAQNNSIGIRESNTNYKREKN